METTLGGDRLGSGSKEKVYLRNYKRSNHNLSTTFTSSMAPGVLYPCYCKPILKGDRFTIDLEAAARTIPTEGPLFGSFKLQVDYFQVPVRLYQAILHNNPVDIGLNMRNVKLPKLEVWSHSTPDTFKTAGKFNNKCLLKYLGMSGIGRTSGQSTFDFGRKIDAVTSLAYYDIFKTYYANKQEENAYLIKKSEPITIEGVEDNDGGDYSADELISTVGWTEDNFPISIYLSDSSVTKEEAYNVKLGIWGNIDGQDRWFLNHMSLHQYIHKYPDRANYISYNNGTITLAFDVFNFSDLTLKGIEIYEPKFSEHLNIVPFPLKNIDDMRLELLSYHTLGAPYVIKEENAYLPYSALVERNDDGVTCNAYSMNGLCLKTYQSDIFNSWVQTEWIDGEDGISELTKVSVDGSSFKIDALNFAEKLYNLLNRIVVSGNTYQAWEDAVYTESAQRHIESPMYIGGMSSEVMFEEIIQSAPGEVDGEETRLGTLGGRGKLVSFKGGHISVYAEEASYIIGIASLTPRICYTQGNEFYMTDIDSVDDFHKPALDGIGFQDLIGERLAWFDTFIAPGTTMVVGRSVVGKLPAWEEYFTDVDRAYGDFAEDGGKGFMVLQRNYTQDDDGALRDCTTYVDPSKYNYAFAYTELDAQNFWIQIQNKITARRLASAKQIPNL